MIKIKFVLGVTIIFVISDVLSNKQAFDNFEKNTQSSRNKRLLCEYLFTCLQNLCQKFSLEKLRSTFQRTGNTEKHNTFSYFFFFCNAMSTLYFIAFTSTNLIKILSFVKDTFYL